MADDFPMIGNLPHSVLVNGREYKVRTDFRTVLRILHAANDPELEDWEKLYVCLYDFYEDFYGIPTDDYEAAYKAAVDFFDHGLPSKDPAKSPRVMDWEQDEAILFPAINKVAGFEVRTAKHLHWWTFMGFYMEISDGVFSSVLNLRMKKAKGKKLEKAEREYWNANKDICNLRPKLTAAEQAEKDRLNALLG